MSNFDEFGLPPRRPAAAADRARLPGVFLIVVGILNLIVAGFLIRDGLIIDAISDQEFVDQFSAEQKKQFRDLGWTDEEVHRLAVNFCYIAGGVILPLSLLTIGGGAGMMAGKLYGLAVVASLAACLPCLGCLGVGIGVGVWSMVVLFNADVRAGFR
jgi:hypothetical protein